MNNLIQDNGFLQDGKKSKDSNITKDLHETLKGIKSWSFDIFDIRKEDLPKVKKNTTPLKPIVHVMVMTLFKI